MNDEDKLSNYEYTVYITEELLKCEIDDFKEEWMSTPPLAYKRGRAQAYKEILYDLTGNEIYLRSLDDLVKTLKSE